MGVGVSLMSWEAMVESGMRGKGIRIVHLYGDHLWWVYSVCLFVHLIVFLLSSREHAHHALG